MLFVFCQYHEHGLINKTLKLRPRCLPRKRISEHLYILKMSAYILFFIFILSEFFNKQPQYVNIIKQKSYNFIRNINLAEPYPVKQGLKRMAEV